MSSHDPYLRYQELQQYVGWNESHAQQVQNLLPLLKDALPKLVDDFYQEIEKHPKARQVITGGTEQIARLKQTLLQWLKELLAGPYDEAYVEGRWRVGWRHVDIGLDQVFTNVALSRLRKGLLEEIENQWPGEPKTAMAAMRSLSMLLDLDLAMMEDAYQQEYTARQQVSERLATVGKVAGGIAHELRNPLNVMKTSAYFLLHARNPSEEKKQEHLHRIERHISVADGVITALSRFAKMAPPVLQELNPVDLLEEMLKDEAIPENLKVELKRPEHPGTPVLGDPEQLRIVFSNLIRNAVDAMPDGGTLTLTISREGEMVAVEVADTGAGMDPEVLQRVMEPLYSTKPKGLGLGLTISKELLDRNQGTLTIHSEPGQGARARALLPAMTSEAQKEGSP